MEDKKEEERKEEEKKEPTEKTEEKEKNESHINEQKPDSNKLSAQEQRDFIDQLVKMQLDNTKPVHKKSEIKDSYPFWETQPVLQFNKESEVKFGEIWKDHKVEDLQKTPFELPDKDLEWKDVDMTQQN